VSGQLALTARSQEKTMRTLFAAALALMSLHCGADETTGSGGAGGGPGGTGSSSACASGSGGSASAGAGGSVVGRPVIGGPGCGFEHAAFCDTFDGPSDARGRGGELDARYWSVGRMQGQLSTTRAIGIGMAVIPACRPGVPEHVWPPDDTLICEPTADIASGHLLAAAAAQNYGQHGYRIRQPFDFAGRTGKIVFDASMNLLSPLHGWVSIAISEEPISMPGYAILGNDEGSIIPKNAVEVHTSNAPGGIEGIVVRHVHVFRDYVDTAYPAADVTTPAPYKSGKLNRFEILVSEEGIEIGITPYSDDGKTFEAPVSVFKVDTPIPFSRGWVQLSVHNHATIKYTQPDSGLPAVVDAAVAQFDNVGFDGPVCGDFREYEVPDALVEFTDPQIEDPYNPEQKGYDIGYFIDDAANGPKQKLHIPGVDLANAARARLSFSTWLNHGLAEGFPPDAYTVRVRVNGHAWIERRLTSEEAAFFTQGPTTLDPSGAPMGDPASQGRLALTVDVPLEQLEEGDNVVEFVTANVPTSYPPLVCNIDLVLETE
jgi:hypothetical protein